MMKIIFSILFTILLLNGCSSNTTQTQFEIPTVDYTSQVNKVNLSNDDEIIAAVGSPVVKKDAGTNQKGEQVMTYYFSNDKRNSLELSLSREFVEVVWRYNQDDPEKAKAVFKKGQYITRALLGREIGAGIYTSMIKGADIDAMSFEDGTEVNHARCLENICRYQVVR